MCNKISNNTKLGESKLMNCGEIACIVKYNNCNDILVKFNNYDELIRARYDNFKKGFIKNRFSPTIYGFGIIGSEEMMNDGKKLKSYNHWSYMIRRCYSDEFNSKHVSYKGCTVCKEWQYYSNFKQWFNKNYYEINEEKMCIDKDILIKRNKIYSPETCIFVPNNINVLFVKRILLRGDYPIGVHYDNERNKYQAQCNNGNGEIQNLGRFESSIIAFESYKKYKEALIKKIANDYIDKIPNILYEAMVKYRVEIND